MAQQNTTSSNTSLINVPEVTMQNTTSSNTSLINVSDITQQNTTSSNTSLTNVSDVTQQNTTSSNTSLINVPDETQQNTTSSNTSLINNSDVTQQYTLSPAWWKCRLLIGQWPVGTKLMPPSCSHVTSWGGVMLLCRSSLNNPKALCILLGEGRTKFLRE